MAPANANDPLQLRSYSNLTSILVAPDVKTIVHYLTGFKQGTTQGPDGILYQLLVVAAVNSMTVARSLYSFNKLRRIFG